MHVLYRFEGQGVFKIKKTTPIKILNYPGCRVSEPQKTSVRAKKRYRTSFVGHLVCI